MASTAAESEIPPAADACSRCGRADGEVASDGGWQFVCPACGGQLLSPATVAEIQRLSDSDRCSLASALGEPMLAQLAELAHDLRVSTMGEMVAGLAHELNQPLYAIGNYARSCEQLLSSRPELQADFARLAEKLIEQSTRAADIVRRLRRFASRREPRSAPVHLNQLVREVEQLMRFHANRFAIRMKLNLAPDLPPVLADSLLIEQVLVNLLRNSFEAMSEAKTPNAMVSMSTACEDRTFVEIAVADHGPGFGDAPLEQLFEAFFTTKPSGMGLGLVISRSIVQAHGGTLTASPNPAGGALFRLRLPVCDQAA